MKQTPIIWLAFCGALLSCVAQAQPTAAGRAPEPEPKLADPHVVKVEPQTNRLGRELTVTVTDLRGLLAQADARGKKVVLFLDGNELSDVVPSGKDLGSNTLRFLLQRTTANKETWAPLLKHPMENPTRPISISVGVQGDAPLLLGPEARGTHLWLIGWVWWTIGWVVVFLVLIVVFCVFGVFSNVLRSPEPDADGTHPYSLSRTQAAFWLFVTVGSFVFIWIITGDLATLNSTVLALIGISAATYLASIMVENPAPKPAAGPDSAGGSPSPTSGAAAKPVSTPAAYTPPVTAGSGSGGSAVSRLDRCVRRIQSVRFVGRFLGDILSDEKGVSVDRFQIFVWTIVLGIIFVVSVFNELSMPEFSPTLLALTGISSATYVGAKFSQ